MSSFRVKPTKCSPDPLGLIKSRRCRCRLIWLDHCDGEKRRKPHQYFSPTHKFIYTSESHFVFIREVSCVSILIEMSICLSSNLEYVSIRRVAACVRACVTVCRVISNEFHSISSMWNRLHSGWLRPSLSALCRHIICAVLVILFHSINFYRLPSSLFQLVLCERRARRTNTAVKYEFVLWLDAVNHLESVDTFVRPYALGWASNFRLTLCMSLG